MGPTHRRRRLGSSCGLAHRRPASASRPERLGQQGEEGEEPERDDERPEVHDVDPEVFLYQKSG